MSARSRSQIRGLLAFALPAASLAVCLLACTPEPPPSPWQPLETSTDAEFRDIHFVDERHGWIVGGGHNVEGGILGETRDGGETWRFRTGIVSKPRSRLFHLNAIHFQDELHGVIACDGGRLLETVDGGQHWHPLVGGAGRILADLFFLDAMTGWAAGEQWILHTTDGGRTWSRANDGEDADRGFRARAIFFVDTERGWLVGHHAALLSTTDAGRSWTPAESMPALGSIVLTGVHFVDPETGWVVGEEGTILQTRDGGHSWNAQLSGTRARLNDVYFADPRSGWVVGYDRTTGISHVLRTVDGGASWATEAVIEGESLEALFFHPDPLHAEGVGRGFAVGDRVRRHPQRILRYTPPLPVVSPDSSGASDS